MYFRAILGLFVCLCVSVTASAAPISPVIDVGTHDLPENSSGIVEIYVSDVGTPLVTAFNFRGQIGDGNGGNPEPVFASFDFTGGIWDASASTVSGGVLSQPQYAQTSVIFNPAYEVATNGLLVKILIDTTGFVNGQSFDLKLAGTDIGMDSEYLATGAATIDPIIFNGTINIVPEPATMALLALGGLAMLKRRRRRA
ncbi:MAG TPA: PEP-CTERM sorting domain-containing protein [Phycisphaerae bacterium]|nr:PEP-CTERM sorting domain-containing protein [Phycisphaerae bacterium]